jgi:hypothetical protein
MSKRRELFGHELRKEGRPLVVLRGYSAEGGAVTVEATIHRLGSGPEDAPVVRPFPFTTAESAGRFVDEAMTSLQYLGCEVNDGFGRETG